VDTQPCCDGVFALAEFERNSITHGCGHVQRVRVSTPDPAAGKAVLFRSDQFSFAKSGVPALYAKAGIDDSARGPVWGQAQLDDT